MSPAPIADALATEGVEVLIVRSPKDLVVGEGTTTFVLDPPARSVFTEPTLRSFVDESFDTPGELSPLLGWLATVPLREVRVEPIGLRAVYEKFHGGAVE